MTQVPRDGTLPNKPPMPPAPKPPTREELVLGQRNQMVAQLLDAEADKAMMMTELVVLRRRIAELEKQLAPVEPTADAD
jgi:hypothetical protein